MSPKSNDEGLIWHAGKHEDQIDPLPRIEGRLCLFYPSNLRRVDFTRRSPKSTPTPPPQRRGTPFSPIRAQDLAAESDGAAEG